MWLFWLSRKLCTHNSKSHPSKFASTKQTYTGLSTKSCSIAYINIINMYSKTEHSMLNHIPSCNHMYIAYIHLIYIIDCIYFSHKPFAVIHIFADFHFKSSINDDNNNNSKNVVMAHLTKSITLCACVFVSLWPWRAQTLRCSESFGIFFI